MNATDISCCLNKLKIKQRILEKNQSDFFKDINVNYGISLDDNSSFKTQSEQQLLSLQKDVHENNKILQEVKDIISPENIQSIDLLILKHKMLTLETSIQNIKKHISEDLENLTKEETLLTIGVTNLEIKYSETYKYEHETNKICLSSSKSKAENPTLYQEVEDFANFVNENGGHEGGWSRNDHAIFLRYFYQIKSRKVLINILHRFLPDFSEKKISNHVDWYTDYISLRQKQKEALGKWRLSKSKIVKSNESEEKLTSSDEKKKSKDKNEEQRQCAKVKINKWKLEKQQKNQQELENKMSTELDKEKKSEMVNKMKQEIKNDTKNEIDKWRASKQAQEKVDILESKLKTLREKERKMAIANTLIREFQKQDSLFIMRRMNKHNKKTASFFPSLRKEMHNDNRDPNRIYKATEQWLSRISPSSCDGSSGDSINTIFSRPMHVQQIPKLCVPSWRLHAN